MVSGMSSGIWNLVIGGIMLIGGLTGRLSFIGTGSSTLLAVVGAGVAGYGVYQIIRAKRQP